MRDAFRHFANRVSDSTGSPWAFILAVVTILGWAVTGPVFGYSDSWQLVINTGTTIVTFLMVFLIQNTQNRDAKAIHLKLDELLRGVKGARTSLVHLEQWTDDELADLERQFERLRHRLHQEGDPRVPADEVNEAVDEVRDAIQEVRDVTERKSA